MKNIIKNSHEIFKDCFIEEFTTISKVPIGEYFLAPNYLHVYQVISKCRSSCVISSLYTNITPYKCSFKDDFEVRLEKK